VETRVGVGEAMGAFEPTREQPGEVAQSVF